MTDRLENIAQQLMESFFYSRNRVHPLHRHGAFRQKPGEVAVLYYLNAHTKDNGAGLMVSEISEKLNVTSPTVTQHIKSLEAQGLVERQLDPVDRRVVRIRLTEKGRLYIQRIQAVRFKMFMDLAEYLGEEESIRFAETLRKASDYLQTQQERYLRQFFLDGEETQ